MKHNFHDSVFSGIDLSSKTDDSKQLGSPSRFGSCRDTSIVNEVFSSPARRSRLDLSLSPSKKTYESGKKKDAEKMIDDDDEDMDDGSFKSAQRKRLKALASKFNDYEDEDSESMKQVLAQATATGSPYKRDLTKTVDVDKIINRSAGSPAKSYNKDDPDFVKSLKAQGFEESSSKTKLVYDFSKKTPSSPDPMQFIRPATKANISTPPAAKSPVKKIPAYRSVSPTRMASPQQRPPSPFKPHPLQFVSPQKVHAAPPPAPPKPPRTYMDMEEDSASPEQVFKAEVNVQVNDNEERTDTASRRSILEKRHLFDKAPEPVSEGPDPAMLPLSQRMALFEKNKSGAAPRPIARFGESVTPAMLSKVQAVPASEPAWKRKRDNSPTGKFFTPVSTKTKRVDTKKVLFEESWKSNDIAREQEEAKKKDMQVLMNRFKKVSEDVEEEVRRRTPSPVKKSPPKKSIERTDYPGINSLKRVKVSPPRPGNLYPDLTEIHDDRPETAMSEESCAPSEAPSLGTAIQKLSKNKNSPMKAIAENTAITDEEMECSLDDDINDMLDEALEEESDVGPTPPKTKRSSSPSTSSAVSWEFQTPSAVVQPRSRDFKTPRIDAMTDSPQADLPQVETEDGSSSKLMHTVSFYRKQKPVLSSATQFSKITRNETVEDASIQEQEEGHDEDRIKAEIASRINKLQEEVDEQMQRRAQASKALGICETQNEFEGSYERVEFERLLLEAHHKHNAATTEINRLKNIMARDQLDMFRGGKSKGTISLSGVKLPLKPEFVKMLANPGHGGDDYVHYFVCLVKYRSQVIATQMLSTVDGINRSGQLEFPNLINIKELDFDFQIFLEVYGLQTPKEVLTHEAKYHIIKKDKSMFNLGTPLKKLKKMESKFAMTPSSNPVNNLSIRKSKFGMVGYTTITIDTLKNKSFRLEKVPSRSPLEGEIKMKLSVHSESNITAKGFLTYFTEVNGYGDWHRRWCVLKGE